MDLPKKIGKYRIAGFAGRGAMGVVYVAYDPFVDRKAAIKVRVFEHSDDELSMQQAQRRFFNEARSAGGLDHPNIVKVYDAGIADGQCFIVMEYVENADSLRSYTRRQRLLPIDKVVKLMRQCADALSYAHDRGVTHRDIKPANIMLTPSQDAKIVDFGIAQRVEADQTVLQGAFGSPRYLSPEQARDEKVTGQSDIYSLGVVFYELLAGEPPFAMNAIPALISAILKEEPKPIESLRPEVSPLLSRIVHRCLHKDRSKRYASGADMVADVDRLLEEASSPRIELSHDEKLRKARGLRFFATLSDAELAEVVKVSQWETHPEAACIVKEGAHEASFYVLVSGEVSLQIARQALVSLQAGDCFGETGYLSEGRQLGSIVATEPILVMKVEAPLRDWASLALQMRLTQVFQQVLIERLTRLAKRLAPPAQVQAVFAATA
ncbi:MAG: serine/threonine-protein kinase [Gammaproteobacteria bacterium]